MIILGQAKTNWDRMTPMKTILDFLNFPMDCM